MTIAVAIRTGSAVVFAADSKVTTRGIAGFEEDGTPRWLEQTYDNATKVVHDRNAAAMAMVAGAANIGQTTATEFISTLTMRGFRAGQQDDQNRSLQSIVDLMVQQKQDYWSTTQIPPEDWPGPTIVLAACSAGKIEPRVWRIDLDGPNAEVSEILKEPGIRLEGTYFDAFRLLQAFPGKALHHPGGHR